MFPDGQRHYFIEWAMQQIHTRAMLLRGPPSGGAWQISLFWFSLGVCVCVQERQSRRAMRTTKSEKRENRTTQHARSPLTSSCSLSEWTAPSFHRTLSFVFFKHHILVLFLSSSSSLFFDFFWWWFSTISVYCLLVSLVAWLIDQNVLFLKKLKN